MRCRQRETGARRRAPAVVHHASGRLSADIAPGAVWIAAGRAAHRLGLTVDVNLVGIVAAISAAAAVRLARNDFAVTAVFGIAPSDRPARLTALERVQLSTLSEDAVLVVHRAADGAADDSAR